MKFRLLFAGALACSVLTVSILAQGKKDQSPGNIDPYSISVSALKGQSATDLCVTVQTTDAAKYPIPSSLKKLQLKVVNNDGDVVYVRNSFDVPITDSKACLTLTDLLPMMPVMVQAHIKTPKTRDEEVLKSMTTVLLRPDLAVKNVNAPGQVNPDVLFNIEAVIEELKGHLGASSNVSLCEGETVIATSKNVEVEPGGQVSVYFTGVSFADAGTHNLSIRISDVVPGEYDAENNDFPFVIVVSGSVQTFEFNLTYEATKNMDYFREYSECDFGFTSETKGDRGTWTYTARIPFVMQSPIDKVQMQAISGGGTIASLLVEGLNPHTVNASVDVYHHSVVDAESSNHYINVVVYKQLGYADVEIKKFVGDYYVTNVDGDFTDHYEQHKGPINLDDFLEVRLLISDGGQSFGGGGQVDVLTFEITDYAWDYSDYSGECPTIDSGHVYHEYSQNFASGATDPTLLPAGNAGRAAPVLADIVPQNPDLVQNYPNPFNPSTNIQFTIADSGPASLKVYDMLGKEVARLFEGEAVEGRTYHFSFNAGNFSSGMYYAKLETGGKQYVKKMLLMK